VATYFFRTSKLSRAQDRSAPFAAAYRAGEKVRDDLRRETYNYSYRQDVVHKEILLPSTLAGATPEWARNRERLWNTAEAAEKQRNSVVAREYLVQLPHELSAEGRRTLAQSLAREIAERHRVAVDLAVHLPRARGDSRNHHAHLLVTTREATATGLGRKSDFEVNKEERFKRGLGDGRTELLELRKRWETLANEALKAEAVAVRIDARTLVAQGIERRPQAHLPNAIYELERIGIRTAYGDKIRKSDEVVMPQGLRGDEAAHDSIRARQQRAAENWLRYREQEKSRSKGKELQRDGAARGHSDETRAKERQPADRDLAE